MPMDFFSPSARVCRLALLLTACGVAATHPASAQGRRPSSPPLPPASMAESTFSTLSFRNIGPANMSGRMADVEGVAGDPTTLYVGSASGGVWKSINAGTTWTPIFDKQPVQSIGDLAVDPTNSGVVYVGSGEGNVRNSVSFGNGVYKTTDGGLTWKNLGLGDTRHIPRIVINPLDTRKVYVAAIGHAFGPNEERGVFMSEDGGDSWKKVLYTDNRHGASDIDIDPQNPNILYAGLWYFDRKQWTHRSGDENGGVYRSTDGGKSWNKMTKGLPALMGRIGIKVAPSSPNVVYVVAEATSSAPTTTARRGARSAAMPTPWDAASTTPTCGSTRSIPTACTPWACRIPFPSTGG